MTKRSSTGEDIQTKTRKVDYAEDVAILVGEEKEKRITVRKNVLIASSTFFQTALSERWRESEQKPLQLQDAEPDIFLSYVNWLYTGALDVFHEDESCGTPRHPTSQRWSKLTYSYSLGDFLGYRFYCNTVTDTLLQIQTKSPLPALSFIKNEWETLPKGSGMRRLILDIYATRMNQDKFDPMGDELPQSFLAGIARIWMRTWTGLPKDQFPHCRPEGYYHYLEYEVNPSKPETKRAARQSEP